MFVNVYLHVAFVGLTVKLYIHTDTDTFSIEVNITPCPFFLWATQIDEQNAIEILRNIQVLLYDDRLMIAHCLLERLEAFLAASDPANVVATLIKNQMEDPNLRKNFELLKVKYLACKESLEDLESVSCLLSQYT